MSGLMPTMDQREPNAVPDGAARGATTAERAVRVLTLIAIAITTIVLLVRLVTHVPFFDEATGIHNLWMTAQGMRPGTDFFCFYPGLGYILEAPYLRLFPDSAFVVYALRGLSLVLTLLIGLLFFVHGRRVAGDRAAGLIPFLLVIVAPGISSYLVEYSVDHLAAVSAIGALVLLLGMPAPTTTGAATALSVLSVMIMPKYALILVCALAGNIIGRGLGLDRLRAHVVASFAAAGVTVLAVAALLHFEGISLIDNIRQTHVLQYRYSSLTGYFGKDARGLGPLSAAVGGFLLANPVFGVIAALGVVVWVREALLKKDRAAGGGWGILAGAAASSFLVKGFLEQYLLPVLLGLALFAPYLFAAIRRPAMRQAARIVLAAGAVAALALQCGTAAGDFRETTFNSRVSTEASRKLLGGVGMTAPAPFYLYDYAQLLQVVPKDETVVAVWPCHPLFRRDLTFVGVDDRPSFANALATDDLLQERFSPLLFRRELEARPPAFLSLDWLEFNLPPGWPEEAERFLQRHHDRYVYYALGMFSGYLRKDLVR
ncbi:MAG: hypothetical protein M0042_14780 [Nitrospiraceae bacterium]|nr:hypothetical protein [Nitrospiraceae bacterium]